MEDWRYLIFRKINVASSKLVNMRKLTVFYGFQMTNFTALVMKGTYLDGSDKKEKKEMKGECNSDAK